MNGPFKLKGFKRLFVLGILTFENLGGFVGGIIRGWETALEAL